MKNLIFYKGIEKDVKKIPKKHLTEYLGYIRKIQTNPYFGEDLENKNGKDLEGCYKIYFGDYKFRIVYTLVNDRLEILEVNENEVEIDKVLILGVGYRQYEEVYIDSNNRLRKFKETKNI